MVKFLKPNTKYKIYGISQNQKWLLTTSGWVPAKEILYYGIFPNTAEFNYYRKLPHNYQQINLALVPDVAFNRQYVVNFWKQCKILNNISQINGLMPRQKILKLILVIPVSYTHLTLPTN